MILDKEPEKFSHQLTKASTPLVQTNLQPERNLTISLLSPIASKSEEQICSDFPFNNKSEMSYGLDDISTWLGGKLKDALSKKLGLTANDIFC